MNDGGHNGDQQGGPPLVERYKDEDYVKMEVGIQPPTGQLNGDVRAAHQAAAGDIGLETGRTHQPHGHQQRRWQQWRCQRLPDRTRTERPDKEQG